MTEDEAFIRAIVEQPGDDLPRLVYADWLDERDNPRGAYLRAEAEWAKPWRERTPPGWSAPTPDAHPPEWERAVWPGLAAMRDRGRGLDPVWVARVSRPPAGVCCDHLVLHRSGPRLSPADVAAGEARLRLRFPPALAAFLLDRNGGEPAPDKLVFRHRDGDDWGSDWVGVDGFGQVRPSAEAGEAAPAGEVWTLEEQRDDLIGWREDDPAAAALARRYLVIGRHSAGTGFLLVRPAGRSAGAVFGLDPDDDDLTLQPLAPSLPELLGRIIPDPPF
ncbi:MAG: TIGR02996 domain-containing protein [Gemmataceae bacterium]